MAKLLIVEDELAVARGIEDWLTREQHECDIAMSAAHGLELLERNTYDVLILDWQLPDVTGIDLCRTLRQMGNQMPVLMLTARKSSTEKRTGLDCGADDYLTKPFDLEELSARIRSLLRRKPQYRDDVLSFRKLRIDAKVRKAFADGQELSLSARELAILEVFIRHPNQVFSSEEILKRAWSTDSEVSHDTLRPYLTKLRSQLKSACGARLVTVHGFGHKLEAIDVD